MRNKIKEYAFFENSMFDGNGKIKSFSNYVDEFEEYEEADEIEEWLDKKKITAASDGVNAILNGKDTELKLKDGSCDNDWIGIKVEDGAFSLFGEGDGPYNGCNPIIKTNAFNMEKEKDYFLLTTA